MAYTPTFGCFLMVNVGKYTIHGSYGFEKPPPGHPKIALPLLKFRLVFAEKSHLVIVNPTQGY